MIRQTSLLAYQDIKEKLSRRQQEVYAAIERLQPCTYLEVCEELGFYPNSVTPRILELVQKGMVEEAFIHVGPTGKKMAHYRLTPSWSSYEVF